MTTLAPRTTIVTALPATGYVGQVVVLTTNGHLYNWTGATWLDNGASGGGGGGLSDGDYGDITVSGGGTAMAIDAGAVTNAKLATIATSRVKGRATAGTGAVEDLTAAQVATIVASSSGGGTSAFLRADGAWAAPSVGNIDGGTPDSGPGALSVDGGTP